MYAKYNKEELEDMRDRASKAFTNRSVEEFSKFLKNLGKDETIKLWYALRDVPRGSTLEQLNSYLLGSARVDVQEAKDFKENKDIKYFLNPHAKLIFIGTAWQLHGLDNLKTGFYLSNAHFQHITEGFPEVQIINLNN